MHVWFCQLGSLGPYWLVRKRLSSCVGQRGFRGFAVFHLWQKRPPPLLKRRHFRHMTSVFNYPNPCCFCGNYMCFKLWMTESVWIHVCGAWVPCECITVEVKRWLSVAIIIKRCDVEQLIERKKGNEKPIWYVILHHNFGLKLKRTKEHNVDRNDTVFYTQSNMNKRVISHLLISLTQLQIGFQKLCITSHRALPPLMRTAIVLIQILC